MRGWNHSTGIAQQNKCVWSPNFGQIQKKQQHTHATSKQCEKNLYRTDPSAPVVRSPRAAYVGSIPVVTWKTNCSKTKQTQSQKHKISSHLGIGDTRGGFPSCSGCGRGGRARHKLQQVHRRAAHLVGSRWSRLICITAGFKRINFHHCPLCHTHYTVIKYD